MCVYELTQHELYHSPKFSATAGCAPLHLSGSTVAQLDRARCSSVEACWEAQDSCWGVVACSAGRNNSLRTAGDVDACISLCVNGASDARLLGVNILNQMQGVGG